MTSVGNDTVQHAAHYVSLKPGYIPFFFFGFLLAVTATGGRVRLFVPGGDPLLRTRGMIGSCSVYGEAPMRQLHDNLIAVSGSGHTGKQNQSIRRCHPYARKSASRAVLSVMQLTIQATRRTPHGASRLVLAMSAWSVKTRRAPSRHVEMRGSMVIRLRPCMIMSTPPRRHHARTEGTCGTRRTLPA